MKKEKNQNKKQEFIISISILFVLVLLIGVSYAWFSLTLEGTKINVLKAGTLSLVLNDENTLGINETEAVPMLDEIGEQTDPYHFTLENEGDLPSDYTIYLDDVELEESETRISDTFVKYQLVKDGTKKTALLSTTGTHPNRVLDQGTIDGNTTITYDLRLWIDENATNEIMGTVLKAKIRVVATQTIEKTGPNSNILNVYQYDGTNCLTGEEATCVELTERPETYAVGTIIKYKVNNTLEKYFYVIRDNGDSLTLQQRENTINSVAWYDLGDNAANNANGPLTVLAALENATSDWTNVKDQTYTLGTTSFQTNAFTGCTQTECTMNRYTLEERTSKARMISVQEANSLGCGEATQTCPVWMNNYLENSTSYGGTIDGTDKGYWTLSADSESETLARNISHNGSILGNGTPNTTIGARAIIEINK